MRMNWFKVFFTIHMCKLKTFFLLFTDSIFTTNNVPHILFFPSPFHLLSGKFAKPRLALL